MWRTTTPVFNQVWNKEASFLVKNTCLQEQIRTTYVLKRRYAPLLHKKGNTPKPLRSKHYVYEIVKNTASEKQPPIDVILTSYVEGLGNVGDKVSIKPHFAYNNLLLSGLAIYASPENIEKYQNSTLLSEATQHFSTPNAPMTIKTLSRITLSVVMNKEHPWTIQPWHIKTCFRKCGYVVPEDAITLPDKPIQGPDMNLENKEFFVKVTINNTEQVNVRCRLHHWSTNIVDKMPFIEKFWEKPTEPVYPEFEEVLNKIPKNGSNVIS